MPVLTCPFTAIPAKKALAAEVRYPETINLISELTIKPVAMETWSIEGISLQLSLSYESVFFVNVASEHEALVKSREFLEKSLANLKEAEGWRKQIFEKNPTPETAAELEAAISAVEKERSEIEVIEKEITELGVGAARERVKESPLVTTARLYARGNELVWNAQITPLKFFTAGKFASGLATAYATAEWREVVNLHTQFDDPLDITERENLKLKIELVSPPEVEEILGGFEGVEIPDLSFFNKFPFELSPLQAVVNYSSSH